MTINDQYENDGFIGERTKSAQNILVVEGYLFEMRYPGDRWSGMMFSTAINLPTEDIRNVVPLIAQTHLIAANKRMGEIEAERDELNEALLRISANLDGIPTPIRTKLNEILDEVGFGMPEEPHMEARIAE